MILPEKLTHDQCDEYRKILDKVFTIHMYVGYSFVIIYHKGKDVAHLPLRKDKTYDEAEKVGVIYAINNLLKDDISQTGSGL